MTSSIAMNIYFLHCQNLPFLRYFHCNLCLNPHIIHGDMIENVSGCFFLNTVYLFVCLLVHLFVHLPSDIYDQVHVCRLL